MDEANPGPTAPTQGSQSSVEALAGDLRRAGYFAGDDLATAIYLALALGRPLLLEGEPGVGKTEVAKVLAAVLGRRLIRLQCYEGLDLASAVYEWDYGRQLLAIRLAEIGEVPADARDSRSVRREIFSREYLLRRPLLEAIDPAAGAAPVLLIDELDRADEEFEAFLLELLSDFQITIPELGTVRAAVPPVVVVTSNRTREIHDALRRRCLYQWLDYPSFERELEIVEAKAPLASRTLSEQVVRFVQALRQEDLYKRPGVAETLDWSAGLTALHATALSAAMVDRTLGLLLKYQEDVAVAKERLARKVLADLGLRG
jgi:MoxR-like ATPase